MFKHITKAENKKNTKREYDQGTTRGGEGGGVGEGEAMLKIKISIFIAKFYERYSLT